MFDVRIDFDYVLAVERDPAKQAFLRQQHDLRFLMEDIATLPDTKAVNLMTGKHEFVPQAMIFACGFS
eukprot:7142009-Lingulodinium_polyedra.AAC.1